MTGPVGLDAVAVALGLGAHELVALVGGGGKTTLLLALGHQLSGTVVLTTTTKMGVERTGGHPVVWSPTERELADALEAERAVLAWRAADESKAHGVSPERVDAWFDLADHIVVEADGARSRPFKAPSTYEPVVPSRTTIVVAVAGADALDRVIEDQCHRPLRVAALAGCRPYARLTPERAARVLGRAWAPTVPTGARFAVVVTKVDATNQRLVDELVGHLSPEVATVVQVGSAA